MSRVLAVIPARYASSRFPGKPLARIGTKPMVQWVYEAARRSTAVDTLIVATDDERIREVVEGFGGEVLMTSETHQTGTDRITEVANLYPDHEIVINIQGDEPGIEPDLITGVIELKKNHPEWQVTTAARPFQSDEDPLDPNRVKLTLTRKNRALYFSRSLIPFPRHKINDPVYVHLGIYCYDREFLLRYHTLPRSTLEASESLEQLRVLENDYQIGVYLTSSSLPGIDTPADLQKFVEIFRSEGRL